MSKQISIYLDLLRFTAAIMVVLSHLPGRCGGLFWQVSQFGHEAVIFFFVLSGFVISYVTDTKDENWSEYVLNRLSRMYSVVFPAIVLSGICHYLVMWINPSVLDHLIVPSTFVAAIRAITFTNESWQHYEIFANPAFWSIGFEVSYYALFGVAVFAKGMKRIVLIAFISAMVGPRVLLYLPIWLGGVVAYHVTKKISTSKTLATLLTVISVACLIALNTNICNSYLENLTTSAQIFLGTNIPDPLLSDYVLALAICIHLISAQQLGLHQSFFNERSEKTIRFIASKTFSIYLYHCPLLFLVQAVAPPREQPIINLIGCLLITPVAILILAHFTEDKKAFIRRLFRQTMRKHQSLKPISYTTSNR